MSFRLSVPAPAHSSGLGEQEISIDCCSSGVRWVNAGSATLSAYVGIAGRRFVENIGLRFSVSLQTTNRFVAG